MRGIWLLLLISLLSGCAQLEQSAKRAGVELPKELQRQQPLSEQEVVEGLKQALKVGSERAVAATAQLDGYLRNELIRIALPDDLKGMAATLRKVGFGKQVDELEVAMNRAAEQAAGEAKTVFWQAIRGMSIADAWSILRGGDHAATDYFRSRTGDDLRQRFAPIVKAKMEQVGLYRIYSKTLDLYTRLPLVKAPEVTLDEHVTNRALDGLFTVLAQEEARIRKDPVARSSELLKRVFKEQDR